MPISKKLTLTEEFLYDIEEAFMSHRLWSSWFIDLEFNEVIFFTKEIEYDPEFREYVEHEANRDRFIPIPEGSTEENWRQVEMFIDLQKDSKLKKRLLQTIEKRHRFQPFLDEIYYAGLDDEWFEFCSRLDREYVLKWLYSMNLITEADMEKGRQLFEENFARLMRQRKQREEMVEGAVVICSDNSGYSHEITLGKTYRILKMEEGYNWKIRIKDDQGKITCIPKAHFELVVES